MREKLLSCVYINGFDKIHYAGTHTNSRETNNRRFLDQAHAFPPILLQNNLHHLYDPRANSNRARKKTSMALFFENPSKSPMVVMDLKSYSHNQLIRLMANKPYNNDAWAEFVRRYQTYLACVIARECRKLRYEDGLAHCDDLIQEVYKKLLNNEGEAFQTYKGQFENTIWQFLEIVAIRVAYNDWRKNNARKRPPQKARLREAAPNRNGDLLDLFPDANSAEEIDYELLVLAVEDCLKHIGAKLRHPERDLRIFKLHLYDGMNAESIAALPEIGLSPQSVFRIIKYVNDRLAKCLRTEE